MLLGADDNEMASLIESRSLPTARVNFNQPLPPQPLPQQIEFFGLTTDILFHRFLLRLSLFVLSFMCLLPNGFVYTFSSVCNIFL